MGHKRFLVLLGAVCATLGSLAPGAAAQGTRTLAVPLDHAQPNGPKLRLAYARYPARERSRGTVVLLAGGPGEAVVADGSGIGPELRRLLGGRYEIVLVDQRGAGRSSRLRCPSLDGLDDASQSEALAAIAACGERLGERRRFLSTYETVLDLEDLRRALGVERIIPLGISYGGQIAGEYARRFPAQTQAVVLDSTSPIEGIDTLGRLPQIALPRFLQEICFTPGCTRILGDPRVMLARAVELLDRRPLRGIGPEELYEIVRFSDADQLTRAELPAALQAATQRDAAPLLRLARYVFAHDVDIDMARFLATTCMEGQLPWAPDSDPASRPPLLDQALRAGEYDPFPLEAVAPNIEATLCAAWPATPRPPLPPGPGSGPDVPVLVVAGREDLRTPLEDQRRAAAQFPRAQVLAVGGVGHAVLFNDVSGCALRGLRRFLAGAAARSCGVARREYDIALPHFRALRDVPRPLGDVPARVGRTAVAVDLTLRDAERWTGGLPQRGLRGGWMESGPDGDSVRLVRYEVVPGVRVSGVLRRGPDTLTVTGRGATGTLRLARGRLRGVLDGTRITYRPLAARPAGTAAYRPG